MRKLRSRGMYPIVCPDSGRGNSLERAGHAVRAAPARFEPLDRRPLADIHAIGPITVLPRPARNRPAAWTASLRSARAERETVQEGPSSLRGPLRQDRPEAESFCPMVSLWGELPQFEAMGVSGCVALCLSSAGGVVTWFVTEPGDVGEV